MCNVCLVTTFFRFEEFYDVLLFDSKNKYNYNSIAIVTKEVIALAHFIIFNINNSKNKLIYP